MNFRLKLGLVASALIVVVCSGAAQQTTDKPGVDGSAGRGTANGATDRSTAMRDPASDIGEPVYKGDSSVKPPVAIHTPDPKFPKQARAAKFSGNVVIALIVDSHGNPRDVHVLRGVGIYGLDDAALQAVSKYKFKPALKNGIPVAVRLNVEVNFITRGRS